MICKPRINLFSKSNRRTSDAFFFFRRTNKKIFFQNKNNYMDCCSLNTDFCKKIMLQLLNTLLKLLALWSKQIQ